MSEARLPYLYDPHPLAFLEEPHHYVLHLTDCLVTALENSDQIKETRLLNRFRQRMEKMDIVDCECVGLSAVDEVRTTLSISNGKALNWARCCIALGLTSPADPADPETVFERLRWPVEQECNDSVATGDAP